MPEVPTSCYSSFALSRWTPIGVLWKFIGISHFPLGFRPLEGLNTYSFDGLCPIFCQPYLSRRAANLPDLSWNLAPVHSSNQVWLQGGFFFPCFSKWLDREMGFYVPPIPTREPGLFLGRPPFLAPVGLHVLWRTLLSSIVRLLPFQRVFKVFQICRWINSFLSFFSPFPGGIIDSVSGGRAGLSLTQWINCWFP